MKANRDQELPPPPLGPLLETVYDGVVLTDPANRITFVNRRMHELLGVGDEDLIGRPVFEFVAPEYHERVRAGIAERRSGHSDSYEVRLLQPDGSELWVVLSVAPMRDGAGEFSGTVATLTDITDRVAAERALQERERRFRALTERSKDLVSLLGRDGTMLYQSPPLKRLLGYSPEELVGRSVFDFVHPGDRDTLEEEWEHLVSHPGESVRDPSFRFRHKDGSWRVWDATLTNHLDDPALGAVVSNAREVSERREAERQIRKQAALLDKAQDAILVRDMDHRITFWNAAAEGLYGWTAEEALGQPKNELIYGDDAAFWEATDRLLETGEWSGTLEHLRKDGTPIIVRGRWTLIRDDEGEPDCIFSVNTDVTREVERKHRIEFQARLLDAVGQAVMATNTDGIVTYWNRAAEELYGWSAAEALGRDILELTPAEPSKAQAAEILAAMQSGERWEGEFEVRRKDGASFPALITNAPIRLDDGTQIGIVGVSSDLSDWRDLERQVAEVQKLEVAGRLAGGIAHDFNNLLTVISAQAEFVLMELPGASPLREDLELVRDAVARASHLTRQLLAFSRRQVLRPRVVELVETIEGMSALLTRALGEGVEVEMDLPEELPSIRVDEGQLEQVLLNLAVNARDAMPEGGRLTIRTYAEEVEPGSDLDPPEGQVVCLVVSDTGAGMDPETRSRIFDPFFTTKGATGGTGLGLSTSYGIVHQSGGTIAVESEPGEGTTFTLRFPAVEGPGSPAVQAPVKAKGARPISGTVLVVEDQASVRKVVRRILERAGMEVRTAEDAPAAELMLQGSIGGFDLVLTDLVLGRGSGREIVELIRVRYPQVPVIAMSGHDEGSPGSPADILPPEVSFLEKPFAPDELLAVVRENLGGKEA